MRKFRIIKSMLPSFRSKHVYMHNNGKLDYLGQIITQMGYNCEGKHRTPQDLQRVITPFTMTCRGTIINSITTMQILAIDMHSQTDHQKLLTEILSKHGMEIIWEP